MDFLRAVTMDQDPDKIYQALKDDNYEVEQADSQYNKKSAPLLTDLCHLAIYQNKELLGNFKKKLPRILATSVDEFLEIKEWEKEYIIAILR